MSKTCFGSLSIAVLAVSSLLCPVISAMSCCFSTSAVHEPSFQLVEIAPADELYYGQSGLKFTNLDADLSFLPSVIRFAFHARRSFYAPASGSFVKTWNQAVNDGFDCKQLAQMLTFAKSSPTLLDWINKVLDELNLNPFEVKEDSKDVHYTELVLSAGITKNLESGQITCASKVPYRAIAFILPRTGSDGFDFFFRSKNDEPWTVFDGENFEQVAASEVSPLRPLVMLYQRADGNLAFANKQKLIGQDNFQSRAYSGNLMIAAFARLSRHLHFYFNFPFEMDDETRIKFIILSRNLSTFDSIFALAFRLLNRSLPVVPEWRLNVVSGAAVVHFPTRAKRLGSASFTNLAGNYYRALAFALPAPTVGGFQVYLRTDCDDHWIMFEDESNLKLITIPHDLVANLIPSVVLYKRID